MGGRAFAHSGQPASRHDPAGGELPKQYSHTLDPFVALTVAAVASKTLLVATGICLVMQRDTIHTAKEVASLDQVSNGPIHVRRRGRLEPRGDGGPRNRLQHAVEADARAGRGDEGDLDPRTKPSITESW